MEYVDTFNVENFPKFEQNAEDYDSRGKEKASILRGVPEGTSQADREWGSHDSGGKPPLRGEAEQRFEVA